MNRLNRRRKKMNNLTSKIVGVLFLTTILVLWWCKETTAGDLLSELVAQEAGKPWPKDFYKTQPGYEPSP